MRQGLILFLAGVLILTFASMIYPQFAPLSLGANAGCLLALIWDELRKKD